MRREREAQAGASVESDPVVRLVDDLLGRAIARGASDIHFEPEDDALRIRYRLDGLLQDIDRVPATLAENVVARLKVLAGLLTYRLDIPQEGSLRREATGGGGDVPIDIRIATFPTVRGERVAVRLLYAVGEVSGLNELGLAPAVVAELREVAERPQGLILVTGPAGSGKSTTLYALARHLLTAQPGRSVVSLEDPVEQRINGLSQIQISPHGELDYARAMRSLLRQDVEVLLVGEIRDAETAHLVVQAALTGHLIMSTLHSGDPAEAIARLVEMGIAPYQVVSALSVCCSQRLLRTVCTACGGIGRVEGGDRCETCAGTGYRGRTACGQIAPMDDRVRQAVLDRMPLSELRRVVNEGRTDLRADAQRWIDAGVTTREELLRVLGS